MKWNIAETDKTAQFVERIQEIIPKAKRMFMVDAYRQITIATPVLTGRAKWGWNCSVTDKDPTIPPPGTYSLDATRANKTFTLNIPWENNFYITNDVPYIGRLNDGYSWKAPARFFELSVYNALGKLKLKYGK